MTTNHAVGSVAPLEDRINDRPDEAVLVSETAEPSQPSAFPNRNSQQAIHNAVVRLLEDARIGEERRWTPRVPWVRSAVIFFEQPQNPESERKCSFPVVTTDISFEGPGLLSWREIPVQQFLLQLSGFRFACHVRWSKRIADEVYRYGLHFLDVLD